MVFKFENFKNPQIARQVCLQLDIGQMTQLVLSCHHNEFYGQKVTLEKLNEYVTYFLHLNNVFNALDAIQKI